MLTSTGGHSTCLVRSVCSNLGDVSNNISCLKIENFIRNIFHFYSVYARMEDLNEDSLYFFLKSGLISRVSLDQKLNSVHAAESTEQR